jgi:ketosteroid isomerase-like protein
MSSANEALSRRFFEEVCNGRALDVADEIIAADFVIGEINGVPPTGNPISVEALTMHRIEDGKIAEDWTVWDALGLLEQIGALGAAV